MVPGRRAAVLSALLLSAVLLVGASTPASAQSGPTRADVAELARQAVTDDDALAELRAVDEIDGAPVDLEAATAQLGPDRAVRLRALGDALDGGPGSGDADTDTDGPRRSAERVLDAEKFRERDVPRPFRGVLAWLAERLRPVGRFFGRVVDPILDLPFGAAILAALLVGIGAGVTALLIRSRSRAAVAGTGRSGLVDPSLDPAELDRRAEEAEEAGDLTAAVRLRFEAGLIRLLRTDRVVLRPETTATDAARQVGVPTMDRLTADFEAVVYGGRAATAADVAAARDGWAELVGARTGRSAR